MSKNRGDITKTFVDEIVTAYKQARELSLKDKDINIKRGRSKSISGVSEELVAWAICKELDRKNIHIFIDQPITVEQADKKSKTIYPDVLVCVDTEGCYDCKYLCDVKTDPGYLRRDDYAKLNEIRTKHEEELGMLKNSIDIKWKKTGTGETMEKPISFKNCDSYDIVFVTKENGGKGIDKALKSSNSECKTYVLTEGCHPNVNSEHRERKMQTYGIKASEEFDEWLRRIKEIKW